MNENHEKNSEHDVAYRNIVCGLQPDRQAGLTDWQTDQLALKIQLQITIMKLFMEYNLVFLKRRTDGQWQRCVYSTYNQL